MLEKIYKHKLIIFPVAALVLVFAAIFLISLMMPKCVPVNDEVTVEAGEIESFSVNLFKSEPDYEVELETDVSKLDFNKTGSYDLEFTFKGDSYFSHLNVVDTTPPEAQTVAKEIYNDETLKASDFVSDIKDCSEVTVSFEKEPDFTAVGEQTVALLLTDASGNSTSLTAKLTVKKDTTPPEFSGLKDITIRIGNSISYRSGVSVTDDRDENVTYSFDSSGVDLQKVGTYKVPYTATDSSGNTVTVERKVTVKEKLVINQELVESLAKKVLDKIVTDDMSKAKKVEKIFNWMRSNMTYVSSPETDSVNAAYVGFTKRRGDCFNYYSMTKLLLDGCGIENMMVERYGGSSTHFWHLVNVGTGWYHYDTTPQSVKDPYRCFMKTDAEVWAYAAGRSDGRSDYYNFDTDKYPERATVKFK